MPQVTRAVPPTLDKMAAVLPAYGARFDVTLAAARRAIGSGCDPANPEHARVLRVWLNKWLCRIRVPSPTEVDPFVEELADWWRAAESALPTIDRTLAHLANADIDRIGRAYGSLEGRTAAVKRDGSRRSFAPTATAKILYFVRPLAVTAWDDKISRHVGGRGAPAFTEHLLVCRSWAQAIVTEAAGRGIAEPDIGPSLGRPLSSVAKLVDEWLYTTITGGVDPEAIPD